MEQDLGDWAPEQEEAGDSVLHRQGVTTEVDSTELAEEAFPGEVAGAEPGEAAEAGGEAGLPPQRVGGMLPPIQQEALLPRRKQQR